MVNYTKPKPNISLSVENLEPELTTYLDALGEREERSEFIRRAIKFYYDFIFYPKAFLIRIISENYSTAKHILRQIGASYKLADKREKKLHGK